MYTQNIEQKYKRDITLILSIRIHIHIKLKEVINSY